MTWTMVLVVLIVVPAVLPVAPPPGVTVATGQPRLLAGPAVDGHRSELFGTPSPSPSARGGGGRTAVPSLRPMIVHSAELPISAVSGSPGACTVTVPAMSPPTTGDGLAPASP